MRQGEVEEVNEIFTLADAAGQRRCPGAVLSNLLSYRPRAETKNYWYRIYPVFKQ